jgi:hypothetical protein
MFFERAEKQKKRLTGGKIIRQKGSRFNNGERMNYLINQVAKMCWCENGRGK